MRVVVFVHERLGENVRAHFVALRDDSLQHGIFWQGLPFDPHKRFSQRNASANANGVPSSSPGLRDEGALTLGLPPKDANNPEGVEADARTWCRG
jgi:hypothetical protein